MKIPALILLASAFAAAIPLRKGASLGYQVNQTHLTTLTVTDSLATDTGTLWNVVIRDSSADAVQVDSALAWNRGTDTIWRRGSCLVPWDLSPQGSWDQNGTTLLGPGLLSLRCTPVLHHCNYSLSEPRGVRYCEYSSSIQYMFYAWGRLPASLSLPDTGIFRYEDPMAHAEWVLRTVNGSRLQQHPWDSAARPLVPLDVGEQWLWRFDSAGTQDTIGWTITGRESDSSGWLRRSVTSHDGAFHLGANLLEGKVYCTSSAARDSWVALGMFRKWSDVAPDSESVVRSTYSGSGQNYSRRTESVEWTMMKGLGPMLVRSTATSSTVLDGNSSVTSWLTLLSHDGIPLDPAGVVGRMAPKAAPRSTADLVNYLEKHPGGFARAIGPDGRWHPVRGFADFRSLHGVQLVELSDEGRVERFKLLLP